MLTDAALRERQWIGLNGLRSVLEEEYSEFENRGYVTSDSATSLDEIRQILFLAALVRAKRELLTAASHAASTPAEIKQHIEPVLADLRRLTNALQYVEDVARRALDSVEQIASSIQVIMFEKTMQKRKDPLEQLIGKTISHVVAKEGTSPRKQVFLVFSDGTYYELFGDQFGGASAIDTGTVEDVRKYMTPPQKIVRDF